MKIALTLLALVSSFAQSASANELVLSCAIQVAPSYAEFRGGEFTRLDVTRSESGELSAKVYAPAQNLSVDLGASESWEPGNGTLGASFDEGDTAFTLTYDATTQKYVGEGGLEEDFATALSCDVYADF